jgi:MFS family permease
MILGMASLPLYLHAQTATTLWIGALMMGAFGMGIWGMAPAYVSERFPTSARGVGPGFTYHAGAAIGAVMPVVLGIMQDNGVRLVNAMTVAMLLSGVLSITMIWLGPETRGRQFTAEDPPSSA